MNTVSNEQNLIAIDLGNGTTSYIAGNGKQGSFPSLVAQHKDCLLYTSDAADE